MLVHLYCNSACFPGATFYVLTGLYIHIGVVRCSQNIVRIQQQVVIEYLRYKPDIQLFQHDYWLIPHVEKFSQGRRISYTYFPLSKVCY